MMLTERSTKVSDAERLEKCQEAVQAWTADPSDITKRVQVWMSQYIVSKYVRADNTMENAKYLGYVDARELYPGFQAYLVRRISS